MFDHTRRAGYPSNRTGHFIQDKVFIINYLDIFHLTKAIWLCFGWNASFFCLGSPFPTWTRPTCPSKRYHL